MLSLAAASSRLLLDCTESSEQCLCLPFVVIYCSYEVWLHCIQSYIYVLTDAKVCCRVPCRNPLVREMGDPLTPTHKVPFYTQHLNFVSWCVELAARWGTTRTCTIIYHNDSTNKMVVLCHLCLTSMCNVHVSSASSCTKCEPIPTRIWTESISVCSYTHK